MLTTTDLSAEPAARDILRQLRTQRMQNCIMAGHNVGIGRLAAQFSAAGAAQEYLTGFAGTSGSKPGRIIGTGPPCARPCKACWTPSPARPG